MRMIDLLHRWIGGTIGVLLMLLGLSGVALVHRHSWIMLPHAGETGPQSAERVAVLAQAVMSHGTPPRSTLFAGEAFGLSRLSWPDGGGAYVDWAGNAVARWNDAWGRPELWLFEFHHYLLAGDAGKMATGIAGIAGIALVLMGVILWWRTRRSFEFRLWPKRVSRPAIVRHHRDLGILLAPVLLLSLVTGATLIFRPIANILFGPGANAAIQATLDDPAAPPGAVSPDLDWHAMILTAHARFPDAEIRALILPAKPGAPITVRMRRPFEWLPNGRTMIWFAPATGAVIGARDAEDLPWQARAFNLLYPLHSASGTGLAHRLLMTLSGLGLALLGSFAVWSFWFRRPPAPVRARA
ncbi:PepSY domain-containing protein [Sphingomonas colocasiae]|uniref:PepSY domain-containing protein n=2 Tax=Sphingomonas colocasiae TaxID=1848973 RepID=A0ABS7PS95_9SPHN|nr:PepSY-associated TM helix domain-containing protein [Sphingomonas colocasiae]MBY8824212.1 PepSY domain-containing protein [Sphingomonas colocasiae]